MSEYSIAKRGKLVLKGESSKATKRKHKKSKSERKEKTRLVVDEDAIKHGNWWRVSKIEEITGSIAIEFNKQCYIKALDNGLFTLGAPHDEGDGPSPEEILTAILIDDSKVAFKSGYGKYLNVDNDSIVTGRADAVGQKEQWEIVFEDGKTAILSANGCFMSVDPEDDTVVALRKKAGNLEHAVIRSSAEKERDTSDDIPTEEKGNLNEVEINYIKKFQKFQDKKLKICAESTNELEKAKDQGTLHEALLDRRSKMKADRYCK